MKHVLAAISAALLLSSGVALAQIGPGGNITASGPAVSGQCPIFTGQGYSTVPGSCITGVGTVTSVGLSLPSIFTVTGSPVTGSGTLTGTFNTQTANTIFAGPSTGPAATPTFRALVAADLPSGTGNAIFGTVTGNTSGHVVTMSNTTTGVQDSGTALSSLAPLASPTFTGTVTLPDGLTWTSSGINAVVFGNPFTVTSNAGGNTVNKFANFYNSGLSSGQEGTLNIGFDSSQGDTASFGFVYNGFNNGANSACIGIANGSSSNPLECVDNQPASNLRVQSGMTLGWASGANAFGTTDTAFSRLTAGSAAVGNGTAGDFSGSLKMTGLTTVGSSINFSGLSSSSAAQTGTVCWTTGTGNLTVDTTTTCLLSDENDKQDIHHLTILDAARVMLWDPLSYHYKPDFQGKNDPNLASEQVGFTAQRMWKVDHRLASVGPDGQPHSVRYQQAVAVLTKAVQVEQWEIWLLMVWCGGLTFVVARRR